MKAISERGQLAHDGLVDVQKADGMNDDEVNRLVRRILGVIMMLEFLHRKKEITKQDDDLKQPQQKIKDANTVLNTLRNAYCQRRIISTRLFFDWKI